MANVQYVQADPFSLAGAGAVIGDTSITLKSFSQINGTLLTMADFGTIGFGTLEPGNGNLEEQISFSGVSQNSNGTATLTGVKTVLFVSPYTQTSGLAKTHAGSTTFVISNTAGFYNQFPARDNDETIDGQWTFTNTPIVPGTVSDASTTVKGVSKLSIAAVSPTNPIVVGDNDPRVFPNAYGVDAGSTDAYAITLSTAPGAYVTGQVYAFKANTANTGAATLNVNSLGAKNILTASGDTLADGIITANDIVEVLYDGTAFRILSFISKTPVVQVYTSGATWTKPTGLKYVVVEVQAAGGGSGNASGSNGGGPPNGVTSGGGGGGYGRSLIISSSLSSTETVTIGTSSAATNGGNSSFGSHITAVGGTKSASQSNTIGSDTPAGGSCTGGDINITGQNGGSAFGQVTTNNDNSGGQGGNSILGLGGAIKRGSAGTVGNTGTGYGGGGSGSVGNFSSPANGAAGTPGIVIVTEYY